PSGSATLLKCLPLAQCFMTAGAALSIRATTCRSLNLALPIPPPPPVVMAPGCVAPHENDWMSVQSLWFASFDSPLAPSIFMNISTAIKHPWKKLKIEMMSAAQDRLAHSASWYWLPPNQLSFCFNEGSLDTSRKETVSPSS